MSLHKVSQAITDYVDALVTVRHSPQRRTLFRFDVYIGNVAIGSHSTETQAVALAETLKAEARSVLRAYVGDIKDAFDAD